jgi:hypothetical protein
VVYGRYRKTSTFQSRSVSSFAKRGAAFLGRGEELLHGRGTFARRGEAFILRGESSGRDVRAAFLVGERLDLACGAFLLAKGTFIRRRGSVRLFEN